MTFNDLDGKVISEITLRVDNYSADCRTTIYAQEGDLNSRFLKVKLIDGNSRPIDLSHYDVAMLYVTMPEDGTTRCARGAINKESNVITLQFTLNMLSQPGTLACDVRLGDYTDNAILTSPTFYVHVRKSQAFNVEGIHDADLCARVSSVEENCANAIVKTQAGTVLKLDNISEFQKKVNVKVSTKNLFKIPSDITNARHYENIESIESVVENESVTGVIIKGNASNENNRNEAVWSRGWYSPKSGVKLFMGETVTISCDYQILEAEEHYEPTTDDATGQTTLQYPVIVRMHLSCFEREGETDSDWGKRIKDCGVHRLCKTYKVRNTGTYYPTITLSSNKVKITNIQLEYGDSMTPYARHVENQSNPVIKLHSKNLCNVNSFENTNTIDAGETNGSFQTGHESLHLYITAPGAPGYIGKTIDITTPGYYTLSIVLDKSYDSLRIKHNGKIHDVNICIVNKRFRKGTSLTFSANVIGTNPTKENGLCLEKIQLEYGTTATEFENYIEPKNIELINAEASFDLDVDAAGYATVELDSDENFIMYASYNADTKSYIDNVAMNGVTLVQGVGDNNDAVMSQKAIKDYVTILDDKKADKTAVYAKSEVYTKAESDEALSQKANIDSVYAKSEVYTKAESDEALSQKANIDSVYAKSEVYTKAESDEALLMKYLNVELYENGTVELGNGKTCYIDLTMCYWDGNTEAFVLPGHVKAIAGGNVDDIIILEMVTLEDNSYALNIENAESGKFSITNNTSNVIQLSGFITPILMQAN